MNKNNEKRIPPAILLEGLASIPHMKYIIPARGGAKAGIARMEEMLFLLALIWSKDPKTQWRAKFEMPGVDYLRLEDLVCPRKE